MLASTPRSLQDIVDGLVPELQRRNLMVREVPEGGCARGCSSGVLRSLMPDTSKRSAPARRSRRSEALRWLPIVVVLVQVLLTATGVVSIEQAIVAVIVVEGLLAVVIVSEVAAIVRTYRRQRSESESRFDAVVAALEGCYRGPSRWRSSMS
jgi:hypothetical protein